MKTSSILAVAAAASAVGFSSSAFAISIDGTLDSAYGAPVAVQTQISNVQTDLQQNPANTTSSRARFEVDSQLSAAYAVIDPVNNVLDLFLSGSMNLNANVGDTQLILALQTNATGVNSLATNTELPGNLSQINFDSGFAPNSLFTFQYNGGIASDYYNLTTATHVAPTVSDPSTTAGQSIYGTNSLNASHTYGYDQPTSTGGSGNPTTDFAGERTRTADGAPTYSIAVNNALDQLRVGSGSAAASTSHGDIPADPGFTGATTGAEYQFALTDNPLDTSALYYTGGPVEVSAFLTFGSFTDLTNQSLGTESGTSTGSAFIAGSNGSDVQDDNIPATGTSPLGISGSTFADPGNTTGLYVGDQYFTVPAPAAVPEPATFGLIGVGSLALCRRRRRTNW